MDIRKKQDMIVNFLYYVIIALLLYLALKYALPLLMPFVLAFGIACLLKGPIRLAHKKLRLPPKASAILLLILFYGVVGLALAAAGAKIYSFTLELIGRMPSFYALTLQPFLMAVFDAMEGLLARLDPAVLGTVGAVTEKVLGSLAGMVTSFSTTALSQAANMAGSIPALLVKTLFLIISSFFFTVDYDHIVGFFSRLMPPKVKRLARLVKENGIMTIVNFLRAYALLMGLTFLELSLGFWLLRIPSPMLLGLVVAAVDILPVVGTGTILIPWGLIDLVTGNLSRGVGILVIYAIITVVRQILEPKVVGSHIGLYPLVTLICMFVGAQLAGIWGLFGLPIAITVLKNLDASGAIQLFHRPPTEKVP